MSGSNPNLNARSVRQAEDDDEWIAEVQEKKMIEERKRMTLNASYFLI